MTAMVRRLALASLMLPLILAGCATSTSPPDRARRPDAPRVRCLSDPGEQGTRPLFFFFCVQSP
jgi:hypothetical protein